jgi:hypothetical protein
MISKKTMRPAKGFTPLGQRRCLTCGNIIRTQAGGPAPDKRARERGFCDRECEEKDDDG